MPSNLTEALDNLYTTTWQNMKDTVADNIFDATPFWFWLRKNGGMDTEEGGRFLTEPIRYAKNDVEWTTKGSTVTLADKEFLTVAKYDWKYLVTSIVRFMQDDQQNRGKNQILSLMQAKLDNARDSMTDELEIRLMNGTTTNAINGLPDLIDTTPATGTVGGIDGAVDTWWRNQAMDFAADFTNGFTGNNGQQAMMQFLIRCMNNRTQDAPNLILGDEHTYAMYYDSVLDFKRIVNKTMGDAGFQSIEFNGIPVVWSTAITADTDVDANKRLYFINTRFLKFRYDSMLYFDMTEWKSIPDQVNDRAAQIVCAGNLVTGRRRVHGVIHNIVA